jgi:RNA polymerase sigma-70 factor (ECF subfamily)
VPAGLPLSLCFAEVRADAAIDETLERALASAVAAAREAWPALALDEARFVRYLAARASSTESALHLGELHVADLHLACACAAGDASALAAFDQRYLGELARTLGKSGVERERAAEVVQILRARLFVREGDAVAKIEEYSGRGPIGGWLRVAGLRLASNERRAEITRTAIGRKAGPESGVIRADPELATLQRRYGDLSRAALKEAFGALTLEERSVLKLHFVDGLNLDRIGLVLGVSRATVGRRMIAARERLLSETLRILGAGIPATEAELRSLLGVLRSQLDLSLSALIDDRASA